MAIITGDLFADQSSSDPSEDVNALLQGSISVPLPTYFSLGSKVLPLEVIKRIESDEEICPNLFFLGRRGTYKTTEGIRIVTLGGTLVQERPAVDNAMTKYLPSYLESEARGLLGAHKADIFLTNDWPMSIKTGSSVAVPPEAQGPNEQQCVAELTVALKPRYHFSNSAFFWEREPFFHIPDDESASKPITRFISLAPFNNDAKQKWLYAFSLDTSAPTITTIPAGVTASPLTSSKKRSNLPSQNDSYTRFNGNGRDHRSKRQRPGPQNHGPEECFFCLSNPKTATHMICSIGEESYLTTAKGPLPLSSTFPSLNFPMHILILPLAHTSNFHDIATPSSPLATYTEMQRYRLAIYDMIASKAGDQLGAVCWEVSRKFVRHFVWQLLPVPADLVRRGVVEAAFKVYAENSSLPPFTKFPASDLVPLERGDYFRVWIWTPPTPGLEDNDDDSEQESKREKSMILPIDESVRFDIQFGRKVMANLLKLDKRTDWRDCAQSEKEETAATETFKDMFKPFDFAG